MENENKAILPAGQQTIDAAASTAVLRDALSVIDERESLFKKVAEVAIKATHPSQWTDLGGKPWPTGPAAETIARRFGLSMTNIRRERFVLSDQHGEYILWVYTATFTLSPRDALDAEGTCSSRDSFLGADAQEESFDEGNIMKAALTNCRINGIMQILGLRGMTFERLEQLGIKQAEVPKVEFQKGGRGGGGSKSKSYTEREIPFGKEIKGKKITDPSVTAQNLTWLKERMAESAKDPEKAKWKDDNEGWVKAIDEELARRANEKAGTTAAPAAGNGGEKPSPWARIRALDKEIPDPALKALVKEATGKDNASKLTDDDVPKVADALKKAKQSAKDDIPF